MGLNPKPNSNEQPLYGWDTLNLWLQNNFGEKHPGVEQKLQISPDWFKMSEDEIIKECSDKGYTVTKLEHGEILIK